MIPSHRIRSVATALSLTLTAALLAAACGGSFDARSGSDAITPGGSCSKDGETGTAEDGCNTCSCNDGSWSCTEMACVADGGAAECRDGETRGAGDGCNTCSCNDGSWACTKRACEVDGGGPACRDGETRSAPDGCNTCDCSDGHWGCTMMACPEPPPVCKDGEAKSDGCNTCSCEGGSWACTDMACPVDGGGSTCVDGETRSAGDGCNTCSCHSGTWLCTEMACEMDGGSAVCMDGDVQSAGDGCNTCTCRDGTWLCTLLPCLPEETPCGGWNGDTCNDYQYCAYEAGQLCGAADASSVCRQRPQGCDAVYDPVCGCDGITYGNACEAAMKGTGVLDKGPCLQVIPF